MLPISPTLTSQSADELVVPLRVGVSATSGTRSQGPAPQLTQYEHALVLMICKCHHTEGQVATGDVVLYNGVVRGLGQLLTDLTSCQC